MDFIKDLVISEIRLPVSVYNRLKTFQGSKLEDPLTLSMNGWELKDSRLKCRECTGNGCHEKNCIYNGNIEFNFPELDSGSALACFNKRAKGLLNLELQVSEKDIDLSLINSDFTDNIKLLSLFGWEYMSHDSITCHLCGREVGAWKVVDVENDHRYWCPWVRDDSKRRGWEVTFEKLTMKSTKSFQLQNIDQVYDWMNSIMPT